MGFLHLGDVPGLHLGDVPGAIPNSACGTGILMNHRWEQPWPKGTSREKTG